MKFAAYQVPPDSEKKEAEKALNHKRLAQSPDTHGGIEDAKVVDQRECREYWAIETCNCCFCAYSFRQTSSLISLFVERKFCCAKSDELVKVRKDAAVS